MTRAIATAVQPALKLDEMSSEDLRRELAEQLSLTAAALLRASQIWTELTRRGADLSALRSGIATYLPRIAKGELAAEAVVAYAGQRMLLQHLAGMPLDEQRRYAAGEKIAIAEHADDGRINVVERKLADLTGRQVLLAIADGRVRTIAAQTKTITRQHLKPTRTRRRSGSVARVGVSDGMVKIGNIRLDPLDLASSLRALGFDLVRRKNGA